MYWPGDGGSVSAAEIELLKIIIKKDDSEGIIFFYMLLHITLNFAGTKATSADVNPFYFSFYHSAYSLDIRFPSSFRF